MIKDLQKAAVMRDPTMAAANIASTPRVTQCARQP